MQNATDGPITIGNFNFTLGDHQLKVWTANPNGGLDDNHWNDTLEITVHVCDALNGVYTIGGASPDYVSFNAAVADMLTCGITGPVIFNVRTGTYTEQVLV